MTDINFNNNGPNPPSFSAERGATITVNNNVTVNGTAQEVELTSDTDPKTFVGEPIKIPASEKNFSVQVASDAPVGSDDYGYDPDSGSPKEGRSTGVIVVS